MENNTRIITIENCSNIQLNGVDHIIGFDEKCVILSTDFGRIVIEGNNMKVESLEKPTGIIDISGEFYGLYHSHEKRTQSLFKRLFK